MWTILLASSWKAIFTKEFEEKLPKKFKDYKIAYITTASKKVNNDIYVDLMKKKMTNLSLDFTEIDISTFSIDTIENKLLKYDMIFMEWWNTFYLLQEIRKSWFDKIIWNLLDNWIIYIWSSAGTYVACPTIDMALLSTHNFDRCWIVDYKAMNLIDFYIKAHYINTKELDEKLKVKATELQDKIYAFTDYQALLIKNWELIFIWDQNSVVF